jgi:hypothetical protein
MTIKIIKLGEVESYTCFKGIEYLNDLEYPKIFFKGRDANYSLIIPTGYFLQTIKE